MQTQYDCKRMEEEVPDILGTSNNFLKSCNNTTKFSRLLTRGCKQNSNALYFCSDIFNYFLTLLNHYQPLFGGNRAYLESDFMSVM